jgi:hypothetical protein
VNQKPKFKVVFVDPEEYEKIMSRQAGASDDPQVISSFDSPAREFVGPKAKDPHALIRSLLSACGGDPPLLAAALALVERELDFDRGRA